MNEAHLLDYLGPTSSVVLERPGRVEAEALELEERFDRMRLAREERGELPANFPSPYMTWAQFAQRLSAVPRVELQTWVGDEEDKVFQPSTTYYGPIGPVGRRHPAKGGREPRRGGRYPARPTVWPTFWTRRVWPPV